MNYRTKVIKSLKYQHLFLLIFRHHPISLYTVQIDTDYGELETTDNIIGKMKYDFVLLDAVSGVDNDNYCQSEQVLTSNPLEEPREFYRLAEERALNKVSFMVNVPSITIPTKEFVYMLSYVVNSYKVAGKTYTIKISE